MPPLGLPVLGPQAPAAAAAGGGVNVNVSEPSIPYWLSPVQMFTAEAAGLHGSIYHDPSNYTTGTSFVITRPCKVTGGLFAVHMPIGVDLTFRVSLWNVNTGTRYAYVDVPIAAGSTDWAIARGIFGTPVPISTPPDLGRTLAISIWETTGQYAFASSEPTEVPTTNAAGSRALIWKNYRVYASGDANPASVDATLVQPVEPILVSYTFTTFASFVQPAAGATVAVTLAGAVQSPFFKGAQLVTIAGGGWYYLLAADQSGAHPVLTLLNVGDALTNAAPGATIATGAVVG